jgi:maltose alpha-D-glucosyltransferase/alpha-amylase
MENDHDRIKLMNSLLLSMPGSPILYYGDEIGMGDNYYLGDRNGVRTPMQWSSDRNAGFSHANPQGLYLPVIIDPEYHYELRNVEVQHSNPHSLLWWTRRILDLRKQFPAFGNGSFEALPSANSKVFAFLRETEGETLLVVANLSRLSQFVELDLSRFRGQSPTELFGRTQFPAIGSEPYRLSLGPHGFFWFCVGCRGASQDASGEHDLPVVYIRRELDELFKGQPRKLLGEALGPYLRRQRWYAGKARTLQYVEILDYLQLHDAETSPPTYLLLACANYADGEPDVYNIPVTLVSEQQAKELLLNHSRAGILQVDGIGDEGPLTLCEATWEPALWQKLLGYIDGKSRLRGHQGMMAGLQTTVYSQLATELPPNVQPIVHGGEQSNTSALFDDTFIFKLFRRLTAGINPDFEIGRELTEHQQLAIVPQVAGAIEYRSDSGRQYSLGVLHQFVPNVGDSWTYTLDELNRYVERVQSIDLEGHEVHSPTGNPINLIEAVEEDIRTPLLELCEMEPSPLAQHMIGGFLSWAETLGTRVGELHVALASAGGTAFAPESYTRLYQRGLYQSMRGQARNTFDLLRSQLHRLAPEDRAQVQHMLACERSIYARFGELTHGLIDAKRTRCHGDLHLGQVLFTGTDFVIIDFEGEPERAVSERRIKTSPLKDVAGMLRSFHYAAHAALCRQTNTLMVQHPAISLEQWANYWSAWVSASFLRSYLAVAASGDFLPASRPQLEILLRAYLLEKALYELRYELNNRPDWISIPLQGIQQYCGNQPEKAHT